MEACKCASQSTCLLTCPSGKMLHPGKDCECVSRYEYNQFFVHPYDDMCIEVVKSRNCPAGTKLDKEACKCFNTNNCLIGCPEGQALHPQRDCECVDEWVVMNLYNHDLNSECKLSEPPIEPPTEGSCPIGYYFDQASCSCFKWDICN